MSRDFWGNLISLFPFHFRGSGGIIFTSGGQHANNNSAKEVRRDGERACNSSLGNPLYASNIPPQFQRQRRAAWPEIVCLQSCCLSGSGEHRKVEAVIVVAVARGSPAPSSAAARRHRDGADTGDWDTEDTQETSQRGWRREALSMPLYLLMV